MQNISFALPTVATAGMSASDQRDIILNQATASIIGDYLAHLNTALEKGLQTSTTGAAFVTQSELVALINAVQAELKSI
jgi:hypothetical protein